MTIRPTLTFLLFPLSMTSALAQIGFGGRPIGWEGDPAIPAAMSVGFPEVDVVRMLAEDAAHATSGAKGPFRFGVNHVADVSMENNGTWSVLDDGTRIWRVQLHCPEANSINFVLGEYDVPQGARVFVWNEARDVIGAFTQLSSGGAHSMGVAPLSGDRLTIQYEEPAIVGSEGRLRITQVTHGYRDLDALDRGFGDSGACNTNTICPEGDPWRDQIAAVAMIVANGNGICTGQLINNCANDGTPYFLTANHCLSGQNPANWVFRFGWESPTCAPTTNGPTGNTVSGSTLLESDAGSDVALLQLNTAPPASYNVWYSGWDATGDPPSASTVIHHPSGDVKKISFDHDGAIQGAFIGADCWHILAWNSGTTEIGSSGSGLWNTEGRLIGQLFGGEASCSNNVNDYFGRFDLSHPLLTQWLGTCQPPVLDGYDPNTPPPALDLSLLTITGIATNYCDASTISPVLTIRNNGSSTLTQFTYSYEIDDTGTTTADWSGSVASGQTMTIPLGDLNVGSGVHVFHATCSAPNGGVDANPVNDQKSRTFHIADPGEAVTLTINTDDFGSETTWRVEVAGTTIYSGGPYSNIAGGSVETAEFCLEEACFTFVITDAVADGICCGWGEGDYHISDSDGDILLDGNGDFGAMASTPFCTGFAGLADASGTDPFIVFPDPSDGRVQLTFETGPERHTLIVRDVVGRELRRSVLVSSGPFMLDLSELPNGRYHLEALSPSGRSIRTITIAR